VHFENALIEGRSSDEIVIGCLQMRAASRSHFTFREPGQGLLGEVFAHPSQDMKPCHVDDGGVEGDIQILKDFFR
jgi:hypothetical protein